jgi:hypothetical protein
MCPGVIDHPAGKERDVAQEYNDAIETQLAIETLNLFYREGLTATQAKRLLEKVAALVEAGQRGYFEQTH